MEEEYSFKGQRSDEQVVLVTKQHLWLLSPLVLVWAVIIGLILLLVWWQGASRVSSYITFGIAVVGLIYSYYFWFIWNNSDYIVTNQRVIKMDQISFFNRVISEAEIDRIQEISTEVAGPIHTLLKFGTVRIKTASDSGKMDLDDLTDPYSVQQVIVSIQKKTHPNRPPRII
ncbi:hypothetical protein A3A71_00965 [Candidatus Berkelbacteria bacterium RIFCSPLOWO2_01_FULL_50_28]|uniref:YdbS-like PH domain-containing protein n=1 Tax=Candidatus Berkelbacteria bacterium RIFCSPLOWO2_01_FULL_50_28 TaxID=1797471 RepID=A0A1F5EB27_9BACT|nr:MAG: hypothetical protein A2807_01535 [Candidatus Berkelbacteria bacterium RIFCSPHIGHO2_01_FULL_50_36]OGD62781.1 MAG: hypothetical protein A3F39_03770 [Candidatus Berkelbacteria bacterium RIFCSPHIGHO2_12_FULL_50_11]OGD64612.1 MAG: hypothetical protein A3A71_00965 [Candidatus Berkelbacteria bacterium RIFCSPLOWO2_01_FULL_50_28]